MGIFIPCSPCPNEIRVFQNQSPYYDLEGLPHLFGETVPLISVVLFPDIAAKGTTGKVFQRNAGENHL